MKKILVATNNRGKLERYKRIVKKIDPEINLYSPKDIGIDVVEINEDGTLEENAKKKAQSYFGKTDLPILANDAGFFVKGKGLVRNPKRIALSKSEDNFSKEEVFRLVSSYWQNVAKENGGEVDAAWVDAFALCMPDGNIYERGARREVILTDNILGKTDVEFPIRSLYISKATKKPAILHTEEEELLEVAPIKEALMELLKKVR